MTDPVELRPLKPDAHMIAQLERLLEIAKSGQLIGVLLFFNYPTEAGFVCLGDFDIRDALMAFERWKLKRLAPLVGL